MTQIYREQRKYRDEQNMLKSEYRKLMNARQQRIKEYEATK